MKTVQIFFKTRSVARAAKFGKMTDNGQGAEKRWARSIEVTTPEKKSVVMKCQSNRRCSKSVVVMYKKVH